MSTKVFVGNLSFKTQTDSLREHFSAAGTVESANIITRGPRSLGYGFVDFKTAADAENAVQLFNQKEIDGRTINVEVARIREENAAGTPSEKPVGDRPAHSGGRRGRGGYKTATGDAAANNTTGGVIRRYRPRPQGGDAAAATSNGGEAAPTGDGTSNSRGSRRGRGGFSGRGRGRRRRSSGATTATNADGTPAPRTSRPPRQPREPRPQRPKEPSPTTLFVANLPFSVTDAELAEIFSGLKVTKAHVVVKRNGKSKGFGFVEFADQEDQLAALKAKDGSVCQERPLNVKVALVPTESGEAAKSETTESNDAAAAPAAAVETKAAEAGSA